MSVKVKVKIRNPKILITIATNSDTELLKRCLENFNKNSSNNTKILICDTKSVKNPSHIEYIKSLPNTYLKWYSDKPCYQAGAYIHAVKNYNFDYYLFTQDTTWPITPQWESLLQSTCKNDVVCLYKLNINEWFEDNQRQFIQSILKKDYVMNYIDNMYMIRTNTFFTTRKNMLTLINKFNINVDTKEKSRAMERGWSIFFNECNIPLKFIEDDFPYGRYFQHIMAEKRMDTRPW